MGDALLLCADCERATGDQSPSSIQANVSINCASWSGLLATRNRPLCLVGLYGDPSRQAAAPPASSTISTPAAWSQGFMVALKMKSPCLAPASDIRDRSSAKIQREENGYFAQPVFLFGLRNQKQGREARHAGKCLLLGGR